MADQSDPGERRGLTVWQVIKSTLAAALGVQSEAARERDFSRGNASTFIIAGFIFTAVFVVVLMGVVWFVINRLA